MTAYPRSPKGSVLGKSVKARWRGSGVKEIMQCRFTWVALVVVAAWCGASADLLAQATSVKPPGKIKDVKPVYPARSLARGDEGVVVVESKVEASGSVADARVLW